MIQITVTYRTVVPDAATDAEIQEWIKYALTERGEMDPDNPMGGRGPEPFEETITFQRNL